MTGWEQLTVWLVGIITAGITVSSVAKAKADARVTVAKASTEAWLQAQQARSPLYPPPAWSREAEQ